MAKLTTETVRVTPGLAAEWYERSRGNRRISESRCISFADDMVNGRWSLNPAPVMFDTEGCLIDGHHRLLAVQLAQKPVDLVVARNVSRDVVPTIDTGRPRSYADHVAITQGINPSERRYWKAVAGTLEDLLDSQTRVRSFHQVEALIVRYEPALKALSPFLFPKRLQRLGAAPAGAAFVFAYPAGPEKVTEFVRRFVSDDPEMFRGSRDPAWILRKLLHDSATALTGAASRRPVFLKTLRALQAAFEGEAIPSDRLCATDSGLVYFTKKLDKKGA